MYSKNGDAGGGARPRVLITGAASGIGAATAARLRAGGAMVAGLDLEAGEGVIACDVRDQASVDEAVGSAIAELGGLDAVVNCAGISPVQSASLPPGPDAIETIDVNLLGPWRVTSAAMPALRESRGRVVNIASGLAFVTMPFATAYTMSKRGLTAYSDSLRIEEDGAVTVTTVYPGFIRTPIHRHAAKDNISLNGLVPAEDLDEAVTVIVGAVTGPAVRDVATTRSGGFAYFLARHLPRFLVDRFTRRVLARGARAGSFDDSALAAPLRERLLRPQEGASRTR